MTNDLIPFEYAGRPVRLVEVDGDHWFVAADVCAVLDLDDVRRAVERLDAADRSQTPVRSGGQKRHMWIINESGLYDLIIRSDKAEARPFRRWVTAEVLPAIRRTGSYAMAGAIGVAAIGRRELAQMVIEAEDRAMVADTRVAELEPAAAAWADLATADGDYSVRDAAQLLQRAGIDTGQNRLFRTLREVRWVDQNGKPYQTQVETGRLAVLTRTYDHPHTGEPRLDVTVRITPKGVEWLRRHLTPTVPQPREAVE